jgi:hypothetical protein
MPRSYLMSYLTLLALAGAAATAILPQSDSAAAKVPAVDLTKWTPPDIHSVGDDAFGKLVKYGCRRSNPVHGVGRSRHVRDMAGEQAIAAMLVGIV